MEFVDIEGFEGKYYISKCGKVKATGQRGTYIKQATPQKKGYLAVCFYKNGEQCTKKIHRLVAEAFIPNPENKPQVNHIDGNKLNNHANNLEWVTNRENIDHAVRTGLTSGKRHAYIGARSISKETYFDIIEKICKGKWTQTELSDMFNVSQSLISRIKREVVDVEK